MGRCNPNEDRREFLGAWEVLVPCKAWWRQRKSAARMPTGLLSLQTDGLGSPDGQLHGDVTRHRHLHSHTHRMARKVSIAEARNHLTVLIHDVERGKKIELTRRGKRVAVLVSCDEYDRLRATRPSLDQALQAWRARLPADFEGFTDDEVRSWRDPSPGREVRFE